jgi:hypothetical protein
MAQSRCTCHNWLLLAVDILRVDPSVASFVMLTFSPLTMRCTGVADNAGLGWLIVHGGPVNAAVLQCVPYPEEVVVTQFDLVPLRFAVLRSYCLLQLR